MQHFTIMSRSPALTIRAGEPLLLVSMVVLCCGLLLCCCDVVFIPQCCCAVSSGELLLTGGGHQAWPGSSPTLHNFHNQGKQESSPGMTMTFP